MPFRWNAGGYLNDMNIPPLLSAGGFRILLTDRSKLLMTVGGATALAAGVYTTRFVFDIHASFLVSLKFKVYFTFLYWQLSALERHVKWDLCVCCLVQSNMFTLSCIYLSIGDGYCLVHPWLKLWSVRTLVSILLI